MDLDIKYKIVLSLVIIFFTVFLIVLYILTMHPVYALKPYNQYLHYRLPKKVFYSSEEKVDIFPLSQQLEDNWIEIRNEGQRVLSSNSSTNSNVWKNYAQFDPSFWKGWNTFPLRMYGKDIEENMKLCPVLSSIIKSSNDVITCIYSILGPGKELPPHYGPFKGVLRYHLGLDIPTDSYPNYDESNDLEYNNFKFNDSEFNESEYNNFNGECYINVDGQRYNWHNGEGVLFDESYEHYAKNTTDKPRMILFLDVKRPLPSYTLNFINNMLIQLIGISPQNTKAITNSRLDIDLLTNVDNLQNENVNIENIKMKDIELNDIFNEDISFNPNSGNTRNMFK